MSEAETDYRAWLDKAEHDLLNIENNIVSARVPWDTVCFHAQQTAEKVLKAFLVYHGQIPPYTHDLISLLARCVPYEKELADLETDCRNLTYYAVSSRYPVGSYELTPDDGRRMYEAAIRVRERILQLIS